MGSAQEPPRPQALSAVLWGRAARKPETAAARAPDPTPTGMRGAHAGVPCVGACGHAIRSKLPCPGALVGRALGHPRMALATIQPVRPTAIGQAASGRLWRVFH